MKIKHAHVIEYLAAFQLEHRQEPEICIVMEHAPLGDLAKVVRDAQRHYRSASELGDGSARAADHLGSAQVRAWLGQLASALRHIHALRVIHRDLAPKNILLSARNECKICDFGLSFQMASTHDVTSEFCGTPYYMSPEVLTAQPYGPMVDVWSLGAVAFELMTLRRPFIALTISSLIVEAQPRVESKRPTRLASKRPIRPIGRGWPGQA